MNGFFSSVSGGAAHEIWLEKVTNNLANVNTAGFKGDRPSFESFLFRAAGDKRDMGGYPSLSLVKIDDGIDMSQGAVKKTGNPLDVAIEGDGFFVIQTPRGKRYSRSGSFTMNSDGILTTSEGHPVMGEGGEIKVAGGKIVITNEGDVVVDGNRAGRLKAIAIGDERYLEKAGDNLFRLAQGGDEIEAEDLRFIQGALEASNVNVVKEMTRLINISRAYEAYQKVIQTIDAITSKTINEVGKVRI